MKDNSPDTEPVFMRDPATQREEASRDTQPEHLCCICDSPVVSLFPDGNYYCSIDKPSWQELEIGIAAPGPSLPAEASRETQAAQPDEHEREMLQVIDQRDQAEDALGEAYAAVVGESPEWSNCFGYDDAINEISEIHRAEKEKRLAAESTNASLRRRIAELEGALKYLIGRGTHSRSLPASNDCGDHCGNGCPWCEARAALAAGETGVKG